MTDHVPKKRSKHWPKTERTDTAAAATKRVLVVEDSPTQAEALRAALEGAGYSVVLAATGDEALRHLQPNRFDVVVSDIVMPGKVDGYELCRRIKGGPLKETPVVLFTSLADPLDIIHGLECGADNFFTKSHGTEQLLRRIKVLLETREARAQGRVRLGVKIFFLGKEFTITSDREQIIDLLMSTFEDAVFQNRELMRREAELARSHQSLEGLYRLAVGLNQVTGEAEVLQTALDRALELPGVQAGWVSLRDGERGFQLAAARNLPPALQAPGAMEGDCLCRRRLLSGELSSVANILECERLQKARGDTRGLRYHASVPLWVGSRVIGVINLVGAEEGLFSDPDRQILQGVGNEIAVALERAQLQANLERLVEQRTAALRAEIAQRIESETLLRASEERYRLSDSILQRIGDLVVVVGPDGQITYTSRSVKAVLGYEQAELLGDGWWRLTWENPQDAEAMRIACTRAARGEIEPTAGSYERAVKAGDGKTRWILWHDTKGPGDQLIGVGVDITERRNLEQQFLQAQKMEAVGQLAGGIAHDFNNLLTAITGYADLVREDLPAGDPRRADLEEIRHAADRAAGLTRQLLAFSRRQVLQPRVLDLNEVVTGLEKMLRRIIGEDVALETHLAPALDGTLADPGQVEQVIVNLAVNARDAMPNGGRLTVETALTELDAHYAATHAGVEPGPYVLLAVSDTGAGMTAETQAHVFEPFFTTKGVGKGTGLGLSTVYGIVKQSGGHITVYSELDHGTTFKVYLRAAGRREEVARAAGEAAPVAGGKETVLLVEDEEGVRKLARDVLERRGYRVLYARNGVEALRVCDEHSAPIQLMITDVVMPEMGGPEVTAQLQTRRPAMKVLYMSGYTDRAIAGQRVLGADVPYLQKPFTPATLARKVREVLDEKGVAGGGA